MITLNRLASALLLSGVLFFLGCKIKQQPEPATSAAETETDTEGIVIEPSDTDSDLRPDDFPEPGIRPASEANLLRQ